LLGLLLALLSSLLFAIRNVFIRQGVYRTGEAFTSIPINALCGVVLFAVPLLISGEIRELPSFSSLVLVSMAGAGIVHFVFGRMLAYTGLRLIGANRATTILSGNILISTLSGIVFFKEPLTLFLVLGFVMIVGGVLIISSTIHSGSKGSKSVSTSPMKGIIASIGGAVCWGSSPALIKIGFAEGASILTSIFVANVAATVVAGLCLVHRENLEKVRRLGRSSLPSLTVGAVTVVIAQLFRYFALAYSPLSLVAPVAGTSPLFVLPLSYAINRSIEVFGVRILLGTVVTVVGVFLIFWMA